MGAWTAARCLWGRLQLGGCSGDARPILGRAAGVREGAGGGWKVEGVGWRETRGLHLIPKGHRLGVKPRHQ